MSTNAKQNEPYRTIPWAAKELGIKCHALRNAVNAGLIPSYQPFGSRRLVLVSEIQSYIAAHREGGSSDV